MTNSFLSRLGLDNPIILAPMGGGPSTPELVAAVSNAGGLGTLAAAYSLPKQINEEVARVRQLSSRPFAINLFTGAYDETVFADPTAILDILTPIHAKLGIEPPALPTLPPNPLPQQFEAVLAARPAAFSFTFGIPHANIIESLKEADILVIGTATTLEEGALLEKAGVDAVIAQGSEAGAHRGTFAGPFESAMVPTLQLTRDLADHLKIPVIASGGLMDGHDIAAALSAGASAVQLGTAFLACPESGASAAYKQAILNAKSDTTVITTAYSGRPARGIRNTFIGELEAHPDAVLPYPLQNALTRPMRTAAGKRGDSGYLSLWAGQGVARARSMPAAELVRTLLVEMEQARAGRKGAA